MLIATFVQCLLAKVPHPPTPEGRDIYGQERDANISYGRLIEVKETYLTDTPAFPESTGKNSG